MVEAAVWRVERTILLQMTSELRLSVATINVPLSIADSR